MSFKLTWKSHVMSSIILVVLVLSMRSVFDKVLVNLCSQNIMLIPTKNIVINFYILTMLLMVPISIVHESIHGAVYMLFGGKVKYGFKGIYAYTFEVSGKEIPRLQFLVVLLSPLVVMSVVSLLFLNWLGGLIFLLNLLGASGDIYMALFLCKFSYKSKIVDRIYGFDITE